MDYDEALAYLEELNVFGMKPGLQRIKELLAIMGEPQNSYQTVHVTGTNGKGSTSAMLYHVLHAAGYSVGLFTSPHLIDYTERIQIDGQQVSRAEFADGLATVRAAAEQMMAAGSESPTQFEVLTALAFLIFRQRGVDYAVIEVGLGGLLDSTNVITPAVSIITNVTMEHADKCGGTLEGIAHHKAGIIKPGVPVVTAARGVPREIIRAEAEAKKAPLLAAGENYAVRCVKYDAQMQYVCFTQKKPYLRERYRLPLLGLHQVENAGVAIAALHILQHIGAAISVESIARGLLHTSWPARFERLDLAGQTVIVDGAHNPACMQALAASLGRYFPGQRRVLLLGILRDKDINEMLEQLLQPEDIVIVTSVDSERASQPEQLAARVREHEVAAVETISDHAAALDRALGLAAGERLLVVCGSLYMVGELRQLVERKIAQHKGGND